jgi:hypothetical protein
VDRTGAAENARGTTVNAVGAVVGGSAAIVLTIEQGTGVNTIGIPPLSWQSARAAGRLILASGQGEVLHAARGAPLPVAAAWLGPPH